MSYCKCRIDQIIEEIEKTVPIVWDVDDLTEEEKKEWDQLNFWYEEYHCAPICSGKYPPPCLSSCTYLSK